MDTKAFIRHYILSYSPWGRLGGALLLLLCLGLKAEAQDFCFVELNCENLFDARHDTLKNDYEFTPDGSQHWTKSRYRHKLNSIARELIACGGEGEEWRKPDMMALVEVENDSVLYDLTRRSLLRTAHYNYVMTNSPDERGVDVALLYRSDSISVDRHYGIRITPPKGARNTRDILYAHCLTTIGYVHVFVVHAPSRAGGKKSTDHYRMIVTQKLCESIDSLRQCDADANIIVAGDFNDYYTDKAPLLVVSHGMKNMSAGVLGRNGAKGTYRFRGEWGSLDHIFISETMLPMTSNCQCYIFDAPFLIQEETKYGGVKPHRMFNGPAYDKDGFSDHLPLVLKFRYSLGLP